MFQQPEFNLAAWFHQRLTYQDHRDDMFYVSHMSAAEAGDSFDIPMAGEITDNPGSEIENSDPGFQDTDRQAHPPDTN